MKKPIYLDYNGTTPLDPEVIAAMRPFIETEFGNPSSSHGYGLAPKRAVEFARRQMASSLNCSAGSVIFTSGGTESNNHAIKGAALAMKSRGLHIITTRVEHPAVLQVCRYLESLGFKITYLPVDEDGLVSVSDLENAIGRETILISVMHANNEVGTIQPIEEIASICKEKEICFHTDAAQSVGKISTDIKRLGVDMLSVAGHKLYAPKGVGALVVGNRFSPEIFCHGAGQEFGKRAGTENVFSIVGLGKACELAANNLEHNRLHMKHMRDRLEKGITESLSDARINGHPTMRLPNTLSISFAGLAANRLLEKIGLEVAVSAGAACHSNTVEISHVLKAMNIPDHWAKGTLRFTTGKMTTKKEIDRATDVLIQAVRKLQ
jgi:cysteine desulfurase